MKYDFTSIMDRKGMDATAIDTIYDEHCVGHDFFTQVQLKEGFDRIPMWVADMNFPTAPTVTKAIIERANHPAFGYYAPKQEYFDSIIKWHESRNGVAGLKREHIGYQNGVLGGVISALNVLCSKGENVLLHSPAYIGFTEILTNNGYNIVLSSLKRDEKNVWRMDFEDMEEKIRKNHIHVCILCSPHNPTGRVWEKWELEKAMELFRKYDVYVVADEIWSDLTLEGYRHIPTQMVSEDAKNRTIAFYAPSKTFNLSGLVGSYHIIYNPWLHDRMRKECSLCHYNDMNVLSMHALIGAYQPEGGMWVDELREVLTGNVDYAYRFIQMHFKGVEVSKPQGTYMLFLDCRKWCEENDMTMDQLLREGLKVGVMWQDGRPFHEEYGIRMNLALPFSRVKEAFDRLDRYVFCVK